MQVVAAGTAGGMWDLHSWLGELSKPMPCRVAPNNQCGPECNCHAEQTRTHMSARSVHLAPHSISGADQARVDTTPVT